MLTSKQRPITINSLDDLLRSFLVDVPSGYHFETTRLQIYPIDYFLPFLRIPTPLSTAPFSYLIIQRKGKGLMQVNADLISVDLPGAMFVHRGSVVSLRSLDSSTTGWMVIYDDSIVARALQPQTIEQLMGLRSPLPLSIETLEWIENLCLLLEQQLRTEAAEHQAISVHLFGALVERLLAEGAGVLQRSIDRPEFVNRQFRQLVFENALTKGSVGFYASRMNVSENYLFRCVRDSSGRSPKDWIINIRLMHAQTLLRTTDATVAKVAMQTGFEDPSYFGRLFRRRFGMSPRAFRHEHSD